MFPIKNIEDLQNLNELVSLENQVKTVRLQDKLGKQKFHEDMKKKFEPVTKSNRNVSEEVAKTITDTSIRNNKALENINKKLLEILNDRGILATYLMSPSYKTTNPKNTSQFKLVKDSSSIRVNDLLMKNEVPLTLHSNLIKFRDAGKEFELKVGLSKMITNKNYNVDIASLAVKELLYEFAKETHFDIRGPGDKSTRGRTLIKLLKSPAFLASEYSTRFLSSDPDELRHRIKLFFQQKTRRNYF